MSGLKHIKLLDQQALEEFKFDTHDRDPIFFDIETGPCEIATCYPIGLMPEFKAPSNWTDPDKIEAKIAEKEAKWLETAALDAVTGEIVAFGFRYQGKNYAIEYDPLQVEQMILCGIATLIEAAGSREWVGHNIHDFDLPFIFKRFWRYKIATPTSWRKGRYWSDWLVDTQQMWGLGKYKDYISLDRLAIYLGHESGKDGKDGKDFHELLMKNSDEAYGYLANDLELTQFVYDRMRS